MSLRRFVAVVTCLAAFGCVLPASAESRSAISPESGPSLRSSASQPSVQGFVLERVAELRPGVTLAFSVFGTEQSEVSVYVEGLDRLVELRETQPGVYEGSAVIGQRDRPRADSDVIATMQRDGRVARATLVEPLVIAAAPLPWAGARDRAVAADARPVPPIVVPATVMLDGARSDVRSDTACVDCAVVASIEAIDVDGRSALSRAFDDHRRRMLGMLDSIGVPFAARERQRIGEGTTVYEVLLRRPDGRTEVRRYPTRPAFRVGDPVGPADDAQVVPVPGT